MKYFVLGFYQSFLLSLKCESRIRVCSFDIAKPFKQLLFLIKYSKARPGFKTMFTRRFNLLECFLWESRFYSVFIIQFSCNSGIFKRLLRVFRLKTSLFLSFLFYLNFFSISQNFEVITNSNAIEYNCEARMKQLIMDERSTKQWSRKYLDLCLRVSLNRC